MVLWSVVLHSSYVVPKDGVRVLTRGCGTCGCDSGGTKGRGEQLRPNWLFVVVVVTWRPGSSVRVGAGNR